jgi:hypothetical protein
MVIFIEFWIRNLERMLEVIMDHKVVIFSFIHSHEGLKKLFTNLVFALHIHVQDSRSFSELSTANSQFSEIV